MVAVLIGKLAGRKAGWRGRSRRISGNVGLESKLTYSTLADDKDGHVDSEAAGILFVGCFHLLLVDAKESRIGEEMCHDGASSWGFSSVG